MTNDEALRIGREAVEDARKRVGDKQEELIEVIEKRLATEPRLSEAFAQTGHLLLRSLQETRH